MCQRSLWTIGLPTAFQLDLFPCHAGTEPLQPFSGSFEPGSFSRALSLLRSSFAVPPRRAFRATHPAGVSALFAASPAASTLPEAIHLPVRSALRFSQPLDGFLRLRLCGLVASRSHVQGFRPGVSPDPKPSRLITGRCPLAVGDCPLTGEPAATNRRFDFEAFLRGPKRARKLAFNRLPGRSPLRLSCPPSGSGSPTGGPAARSLRS